LPRRNHRSIQARKRIARELRKLVERVNELERELQEQWIEDLNEEIRRAMGDDEPTSK